LNPVWLPFFDNSYIKSIDSDWDAVKSYAIGDTGFEILDSEVIGVTGTSKYAVAFCKEHTYIGRFIYNGEGSNTMITIAWTAMWLGMKERSCFGMSNTEVLFIDSNGSLVKIDSEGKPQLLDYRLWTPSSAVSITYDDHTGYWYISNGTYTRVLGQGLGGCSRHYTSLIYVDGVTKSLYVEGASEDLDCLVEVAPTDFGLEGEKRLVSVNVGGVLTVTGKFKVYAKYAQSQDGSYTTGSTINTNNHGFCGLSIGANKFKLGITGTVGTSSINRVIVEIEDSDKRYARSYRGNL
jgi:hypothetical protein